MTLGDEIQWGLTEQLLATIVDAVNAGNWQREGNKNRPKPKPIPRPGVTDTKRRFKSRRSYSISEMRDIQRRWGQKVADGD